MYKRVFDIDDEVFNYAVAHKASRVIRLKSR